MREMVTDVSYEKGTDRIRASETDVRSTCCQARGQSRAITVLYDNNRYDPRLIPGWGLSCLVEGLEKTILFDSGGDGSVLLHNMGHLGIEPARVDVIVLTHIHGDHTGGLGAFLREYRGIVLYVPLSFPKVLKEDAVALGAHMVEVSGPKEIFSSVFTTGELGSGIREQSLVLRTDNGLIIITGCAHPGVVEVVRKAKEITGEDRVYLALGGFHLAGESPSRLKSILKEFRRLSVQKVAPCHCSGDGTRRLFKEEYGVDCIECGVGRIIRFP
jgi:7,8-dihydropterin-6-yl-methyl-4-(beta-D-ribofuranosyl)aminobenzene 5'-phosphate synthase